MWVNIHERAHLETKGRNCVSRWLTLSYISRTASGGRLFTSTISAHKWWVHCARSLATLSYVMGASYVHCTCVKNLFMTDTVTVRYRHGCLTSQKSRHSHRERILNAQHQSRIKPRPLTFKCFEWDISDHCTIAACNSTEVYIIWYRLGHIFLFSPL